MHIINLNCCIVLRGWEAKWGCIVSPQDVTGYFNPYPLPVVIGPYLTNDSVPFVYTQQMSLFSWDEDEIMK
jgi:hypothetical protein